MGCLETKTSLLFRGEKGKGQQNDFLTHVRNVVLSRAEGFVQYFQETHLKALCSFLTH